MKVMKLENNNALCFPSSAQLDLMDLVDLVDPVDLMDLLLREQKIEPERGP